jgi:hypothetical protein
MNNDTNFIFEAYKQKTCLEYVNPDASEMVRTSKEEKDRESARKRDYSYSGRRSSRGSRWDNDDAPSSRSGAYDDDYHGEDAESSPLARAMHAAATELDRLKTCSDIIKDVASKHDVDLMELTNELKAAGAIDENDLKSVHSHSEDAEEGMHCSYAKKGCKCSKCQKCIDNQTMSEDAETYGIEGQIKAALQEVESVGYGGDSFDPKEVAKLVAGSPVDWGDSYGPLVQALEVVISNYYERGLQDS